MLMQSYSGVAQPNGVANDPTNAIPKHYSALVNILCQLSEAYYYQGSLDTAMTLLDSNNHILDNSSVTAGDRARFQVQRGKMLYYQGAIADTDSEAALAVLLDAQELAKSSKADGCLAKALDLIGLVFYAQAFSNSNFEKPREYFQ
jgi:hypothetical protein